MLKQKQVCVGVEGNNCTGENIQVFFLPGLPPSSSWIKTVALPGEKVTPSAVVAKTIDKVSVGSISVSGLVCRVLHKSCWSFPGPKVKEAEKEL